MLKVNLHTQLQPKPAEKFIGPQLPPVRRACRCVKVRAVALVEHIRDTPRRNLGIMEVRHALRNSTRIESVFAEQAKHGMPDETLLVLAKEAIGRFEGQSRTVGSATGQSDVTPGVTYALRIAIEVRNCVEQRLRDRTPQ